MICITAALIHDDRTARCASARWSGCSQKRAPHPNRPDAEIQSPLDLVLSGGRKSEGQEGDVGWVGPAGPKVVILCSG
jgi:hypothetical protein